MSEMSYDDFEKMEESKVSEAGYTQTKYDEKEFVLNLLKEQPYSRKKLKEISEEAGFVFSDARRNCIEEALADMTKDDIVESRYGSRGEIYYGLKRKEESTKLLFD